jgi:hypothetical protein
MKTTTRLLILTALTAALLVTPLSVSAGDKSFTLLVDHIRSDYKAERQSLFGLGMLSRVAVKVVRPAGVKSLKFAILKNLEIQERREGAFLAAVDRAVTPYWQPLMQFRSRRSNQWTCIYTQDAARDLKLLIVTRNAREAVVAQVRLDPDKLMKFMERPTILGISLDK